VPPPPPGCRFLHQNDDAEVQELLCAKLWQLPETSIEHVLLQLVYLAVARPSSPVERFVIQLCAQSFRIAVKVCSRQRA